MRSLFLPFLTLLFLSPLSTSAHEVYVLSSEVANEAITTPAFSLGDVFLQNLGQFAFWAVVALLVVGLVFYISRSRALSSALSPLFSRLSPHAPTVLRVTIGVSLIVAAYHRAMFGPELSVYNVFGGFSDALPFVLAAVGVLVLCNLYMRVALSVAVVLFIVYASVHGVYMLTYVDYLGAFVALLLLRVTRYEHFAFPLLRIAFGVSLLFSSLYAKVIHNNLALQVAYAHPGLVAFFGLEPHFLVLGAAIVEALIALFFIFGIEIRFASLFLLFWLTLSLIYFGEAVWPHLILFGIPIAFFLHGPGRYSLEKWIVKTD